MTYHVTPAIVAPIIGVVLSVARSLAPVREVAHIRSNRRLGVSLDLSDTVLCSTGTGPYVLLLSCKEMIQCRK